NRGSALASSARAALCMGGLIECLSGWPSTARCVPGRGQVVRSERERTGSFIRRRSGGDNRREHDNAAENEPIYRRARPTDRRRGLGKSAAVASGRGVAFVGGVEFLHEAAEEAGVGFVAFDAVVFGEIAAAAAEHFAHRGGGEVAGRGRDLVVPQEGKNVLGGAERALLERVDEEGLVVLIATDHEVSGQADGF